MRGHEFTFSVFYFPDTDKPVPALMTEDEVLRFTRLDETNVKDPGRTLARYREMGLLKACKVGRNLRYRLWDVLDFLERIGDEAA